ncbi:MAG: riboflavin synthase [Oligoflexales bacterium]
MFTGLVEKTVVVRENQAHNLVLERPAEYDASTGDSIAVNGCCLTVCADSDENQLVFDVSSESLAKTSLGDVKLGGLVHIERALKLGDRLGGHWVSGHVDDCGYITNICNKGGFCELAVSLPEHLCPYVIEKGSLTIDGVSLTINKIEDEKVFLMLIPATLAVTHFDVARVGQKVNLEVDILGKYVERLMATRSELS